MAKPYLALGLSGPHLVELTASDRLLSRWDALPLAFTILGIDRIDGSPPGAVTLASSAVGATLAGATRHGRFFIAAAAQHDHPYNLARRVASLGHLSRGRSGLLIGLRDAYAPNRHQHPDGEVPAGVGGREHPATSQVAYDAAYAVRALEQSWPHDSILGDRQSGILVQSDRIDHVDLDSSFSIAGPLNTPEPATGASVIAWHAATAADLPPRSQQTPVELIIGAAGAVPVVNLGAPPPETTVEGVVLRAAPNETIDALLDAAEDWLASRFAALPAGLPLRAALALPAPARLIAEPRPAFPVPKPSASL